MADRSVSVPMAFGDVETHDRRGTIFRRISCTRNALPIAMKFGMVTYVGRGMFVLG